MLAEIGSSSANCSSCLPVTYQAPPSADRQELHIIQDAKDLSFSDLAIWRRDGNYSSSSSSGSSSSGEGHITLNTTDGWNVGNESTSEQLAGELMQDITLGAVLFSLSMLTFVGNAMVLHAVRTEKRLQSVSNMFIVSLAIADLIVGLIVMPISAIYIFTEEWVFGVAICQFWISVDYTASTASILNLFILSLDRYWSVTSPLRYMRKRTKKRALIMISLVWFISSLWLIPIIGWHHFEYGGVRTVPQNVCDTEYATNTVLKIITAIFNFYLPLAIMYGLYTKIFMEIRKRSKFELGQRTAGYYNSVKESGKLQLSSLTDDSDHRKNCESDDLDNPMQSISESRKFLDSRLTTTTDYETETSDDDTKWKKVEGSISLKDVAKSLPDPSESKGRVNVHKCKEGEEESATDAIHHSKPSVAETSLTGASQRADQIETVKIVTQDTMPVDAFRGQGSSHYAKRQAPPANKRHVSAVRKKQSLHCENERQLLMDSTNCNANIKEKAIKSKGTALNGGKFMIVGCISDRSRENDGNICTLQQAHHSTLSQRANKLHCRWFQKQQRQATALKLESKGKPKESKLKVRAKKAKRKMIRPSAALAKEIKAARQLGVIMGAFTLCFCPYFVLFMVVAFCDGCISNQLMTAMTWIGYLNSAMNPFLYPLCNMQFRNKFRKMLHLKDKDENVRTNLNNSQYMPPRTSIVAYESRNTDY